MRSRYCFAYSTMPSHSSITLSASNPKTLANGFSNFVGIASKVVWQNSVVSCRSHPQVAKIMTKWHSKSMSYTFIRVLRLDVTASIHKVKCLSKYSLLDETFTISQPWYEKHSVKSSLSSSLILCNELS